MLKRYYNRVIIFGRGNSMRKTDKGFSLVELLIVVIIIGILAGILYLVVGPSDDMVKEKACSGNRATIMLALDAYRFSNGVSKESYTLQNFIDDNYKDNISNKEVKCPSDGIYSAGTLNGREAVVCSVHGGGGTGGGDDPGGGDEPDPPGNIIPGTDTFGGDGYQAIDDWEEAIVDNHNLSFNEGQKFLSEGNYYVATTTLSNIYYSDDSSPEMSPDKWWTTQSAGGLVQFTGVSKSWDEVETGYRFYRGDILYYNGDYYVCRVEGYTGYYEVTKGEWWSNTPDLSGSAWAWYKLSS